jgi:beta-glucanase (GH16 family)
VALAAFAAGNSALGQLTNASFDDGGGSLYGWSTFNNSIPNVLAAPITPRTGTHVAKVFGGFNGNPNWSGLLQSQPAAPGEVWTASCFARHNSSDALAGGNELILKIEFYRVPNGEYGTADMLAEKSIDILDSGSPQNTWLPNALPATAPADTVEARIAIVFMQRNNGAGAALVDDVTFGPGPATPPPSGSAWRVLWHDEFEGTSIDTDKWRVEDLFLIKNNELQYYAPDDVYVQNGLLTLRSQERSYWGIDQNGNWGWHDYTSGLVESKGRFYNQYGRVEVRAKLPSTQGMWPAHWMMAADGDWPPEIDVMELLGHDPNTVYMTMHWGEWPGIQSYGGSYTGPDYSQDFHTFAIEWRPGRIDWLIDGQMRFFAGTGHPGQPFDQPFFLILNTAVGGDWPGNPDGSTVFPQYHEIDYVRWYVQGEPADFNGDEEVDLDDYSVLADCLEGPGRDPAPAPPRDAIECLTVFDFNEDEDVDLEDFGTFQSALGT